MRACEGAMKVDGGVLCVEGIRRSNGGLPACEGLLGLPLALRSDRRLVRRVAKWPWASGTDATSGSLCRLRGATKNLAGGHADSSHSRESWLDNF